MAAGFKISHDAVVTFRERFCEQAAQRINCRSFGHTLVIDAEVPLSLMTVGLVKSVQGLHPFGQGNRRPVFLSGGLQVQGQPRLVGQGERHVNFMVREQTGPAVRVIAFGMADRVDELMSERGQCSLVYTPKINEWQGYTRVDLEVIDFQPGPAARLE
jgi:single-stranded-DNA-specific exonuclease